MELVGPDLGTVLEPGRNTWNLVVPLVHLWEAKSGLLFVSSVVAFLRLMLKQQSDKAKFMIIYSELRRHQIEAASLAAARNRPTSAHVTGAREQW